MAERKLSPRARRIVEAGRLLAGDRWQTAMAEATGLSKQLLSFIANGDRAVTDDVYRKIADGLIADGMRVRNMADKIDEIAGRMLAELDGE